MTRTSVLVGVVLVCCQCSPEVPSTTDAGPVDAVPARHLESRTIATEETITSLAVTPDEATLLFCAAGGERTVGTLNNDSLEAAIVIPTLELHPALATAGYCRLSVIGEHAYARYEPTDFLDPKVAVITKLRTADAQPVAFWDIPSAVVGPSDWGHGLFSGLAAIDGGKALVPMPRTDKSDGIYALVVDLETGVFEDRKLDTLDGVFGTDIYGLLDGHRVLGMMRSWESSSESYSFVLPLSGPPYVWSSHSCQPRFSLAWSESSRRIASLGVPSVGWMIYDMDSGARLWNHEYQYSGFPDAIRFLPGERVLVVSGDGSGELGTLAIYSQIDGRALAEANVPGYTFDALVIEDGRRILLAGTYSLTEVEVPLDL